MLRQAEIDEDCFEVVLEEHGIAPLRRARITTLQLNIGLRCNLACHHCHVESGPKRSERIDRRGIDRVLWLLERNPQVELLDVTGGAPELHPDFRHLVREARRLGRRVIDRCNLTVLREPGQETTADFLADHEVEIVASLPCYGEENVDKQRGRGVFEASIEVLQELCGRGYGRSGGRLKLDLVYNPVGAFLPPAQHILEEDYRRELREAFGIEFDHLLTITNMPVKRFAHELLRDGRWDEYMSLLVESFNPETVPALMCRHLISIDHEGRLFDCDFNQALDLPVPRSDAKTIFDVENLDSLSEDPITTAAHCLGCTAGAGSSCGGALS